MEQGVGSDGEFYASGYVGRNGCGFCLQGALNLIQIGQSIQHVASYF
jgi:hypothetical protein